MVAQPGRILYDLENGFYCIRDGLKPDLRKFWLAELVKHKCHPNGKIKVDEYARKQIQIWYKTVLSLLEDDPTPTEDSELADDPIPEAYRIIKDISIYGGASSKARIVEAQRPAGCQGNKTVYASEERDVLERSC